MFNLPIVVQSPYYLRMYVCTVCFILYANVFQGASKIIGVRTGGGGGGQRGHGSLLDFTKRAQMELGPRGCIDLSHLCDL